MATAADTTFTYPIEISDWHDKRSERLDILVGADELYTTLPSSLLARLGVTPTDTREYELPDGSILSRDIAEVIIKVDGQEADTIVVFGDEDETPTLGRYSLEGLGLSADCANKRLTDTPFLRL